METSRQRAGRRCRWSTHPSPGNREGASKRRKTPRSFRLRLARESGHVARITFDRTPSTHSSERGARRSSHDMGAGNARRSPKRSSLRNMVLLIYARKNQRRDREFDPSLYQTREEIPESVECSSFPEKHLRAERSRSRAFRAQMLKRRHSADKVGPISGWSNAAKPTPENHAPQSSAVRATKLWP